MMFSHWMGMNLGALAWLSMRFESPTVSHLKSSSGIFLHCCWRRCALALRYVRCGGHMPQLITMVQCCGIGEKERRDAMLLCRFPHTKKDSYPLLWIQEALESMVGTAHFSTMDFKSGFWQVKVAPESQQYTAFTIGNLGFYKFTHMPFGLCNVPVTFQRLMQNTLGELNLTYCIIYLDNMFLDIRKKNTWSIYVLY